MGSKRRISKNILPIILKNKSDEQNYVEPFCGGCNTIDKVTGNRIANDINYYLIELWKALVNDNWIPPNMVTEQEYNDIKNFKGNYPPELVGFVGIVMSFGSKWFGGYSRNKRGTNYAIEGRDNLVKQIGLLNGVEFYSGNYDEFFIPPNSIIYCDPPYYKTTGYKIKFDHEKFWERCIQKVKEEHQVFISEYEAPSDFVSIWEQTLKSNMEAVNMKTSIEKLFVHKSQL